MAEIQAEEGRQERERLEREKREKRARQKELGLAQASVWGSASTNLSWANKTSSFNSGQQPSGFWDTNNDPPMQQQQQQEQHHQQQQPPPQLFQQQQPPQQQQQQLQQQQNQKKKNKNNANKAKEENKVAAIFKESKAKPANDFEAWCTTALDKLGPQVDIPTFLSFLNDVESPYEVHFPIYDPPKKFIYF